MNAKPRPHVFRRCRFRAVATGWPLPLLAGLLGFTLRPDVALAQFPGGGPVPVAVVRDVANQQNFSGIHQRIDKTNRLLGEKGDANSVIGLLNTYVNTYFGKPDEAVRTTKISAAYDLVKDPAAKVPTTAGNAVSNPSPVQVKSAGLSSLTGKVNLPDVNFAYTGELGSASGGATPVGGNGLTDGLYPVIPEGEKSGGGIISAQQKYEYAASDRIKVLFKPHTAVEKQVNFAAGLFQDTDERIRLLRTELSNTLNILQSAKDFTTLHAAQTKISAMQAELQMQIGFRTAALQNVQMLDISNRNNESKRQLASQFQTTEAMRRAMVPGAADVKGIIENPTNLLSPNALGLLSFLATADFSDVKD